MKKHLVAAAMLVAAGSLTAQTSTHRFNFSIGGAVNQYNGNLGSSFFKFDATCFAGFVGDFSYSLNRSFDASFGMTVGHFGYCATEEDMARAVPASFQCPGCADDRVGMGDLRSLMVGGNLRLKYKFANGYILKENARFAPYIYGGAGMANLSDVMGRNCVNVGNFFLINGGAGVKYNVTDRISVSYEMAFTGFPTKHVYAAGTVSAADGEEAMRMAKRTDFLMQNSLSIGFSF